MGDQFQCPNCGQLYALTPQQVPRYAGQAITCTQCGRPFVVPREMTTTRAKPLPAAMVMPAPVASPEGAVFAPPPLPGASSPRPRTSVARQAPDHPAPPPPFHFVASSRFNGWAVASLVLGIIGLVIPIVLSLLAILLGFAALNRTRDPRVRGKGIALAGLVLGFAGLMLGTFYISIAVPVWQRLRQGARREDCAVRLRGVGVAMRKYAAANAGTFPDQLRSIPFADLPAPGAFACPVAKDSPPIATLPDGRPVTFIYVGQSLTTSAPAETVLMYEPLSHHGEDGMNVLFVDGRVQFIGEIEASKATARLRKGQNPPWTVTD
jgi:prepilin-type processing-associated H-X9-DG protein